jgi:hypothetical protein
MTRIQSIIFDRHFYTIRSARQWLKNTGFKYTKVHTTKRYHRFRQLLPLKNKSYRAVEISPGIKFIFEI